LRKNIYLAVIYLAVIYLAVRQGQGQGIEQIAHTSHKLIISKNLPGG